MIQLVLKQIKLCWKLRKRACKAPHGPHAKSRDTFTIRRMSECGLFGLVTQSSFPPRRSAETQGFLRNPITTHLPIKTVIGRRRALDPDKFCTRL